MQIELVTPPTEAKGFERGERVIMVDGVKWGQTEVRFMGRHGNRVTFKQEGGYTLIDDPDGKYENEGLLKGRKSYRAFHVDSDKMEYRGQSRYGENTVPKTTLEQRVIAKINTLIEAGHLRHPDTVRAEMEAENNKWQTERAAKRMALATEIRERAMKALGINDPTSTDPKIEAVEEAMRWAITQHLRA